jgi:hypothetical protein
MWAIDPILKGFQVSPLHSQRRAQFVGNVGSHSPAVLSDFCKMLPD